MEKMKFFIDTHDQKNGTFPAGLKADQFGAFYEKFQEACAKEGVIQLRAHVGLEDGRAYCFNLAPSAEAVRRAHEIAGLPFDSITEVSVVTPGDMYFRKAENA
jgi:Protein of unknown function (DUF4242)